MELSKQQEAFKQDLTKAIAEAWDNEAFKNEFIASPKKAIESLTGKTLNIKEGINLVVTDQSAPSTVYINLPNKPDVENMELSEEQLEAIAGGNWLEEIAQGLVDAIETVEGWTGTDIL